MTRLPCPRSELPTMAQRRAADNVRPHGSCNPVRCLMMRTPPAHTHGDRCITCSFRWHQDQTHCHLYETCDRCHDGANPCDTAQQIAEELDVDPVTWGSR